MVQKRKNQLHNFDIMANMPELEQNLRMKAGKTGSENGINGKQWTKYWRKSFWRKHVENGEEA